MADKEQYQSKTSSYRTKIKQNAHKNSFQNCVRRHLITITAYLKDIYTHLNGRVHSMLVAKQKTTNSIKGNVCSFSAYFTFKKVARDAVNAKAQDATTTIMQSAQRYTNKWIFEL